jgi:hypothetical protein
MNYIPSSDPLPYVSRERRDSLLDRIRALPALSTEALDIARMRFGNKYHAEVPAVEAELLRQWRREGTLFVIDVPTLVPREESGRFVRDARGNITMDVRLTTCGTCDDRYVSGYMMVVASDPKGSEWYKLTHRAIHVLESQRLHRNPLAKNVVRNLEKMLGDYSESHCAVISWVSLSRPVRK